MKTGDSPVYAYQRRASMIDFPGRMAAVFLTAGCNFRCGFCHNPHLIEPSEQTLPWEQLEAICSKFQEQWVNAAVVSGGEPTRHKNLPDLIQFFKQFGWAVKLDTNGSNPDLLEGLLPDVDYVAMDIKCSLDCYPQLTGYKRTDKLKRSIELLKQNSTPFEFRTTVISTVHNKEELEQIAMLAEGAPLHILQPFVPRDNLPNEQMRNLPRTSPDMLDIAQKIIQPKVETLRVYGAQS